MKEIEFYHFEMFHNDMNNDTKYDKKYRLEASVCTRFLIRVKTRSGMKWTKFLNAFWSISSYWEMMSAFNSKIATYCFPFE